MPASLRTRRYSSSPSDRDRRPVSMSAHSQASRGALNRNCPPGSKADATRPMMLRWSQAGSRKSKPIATAPLNFRSNSRLCSAASQATVASGKCRRNCATSVGEASIPKTSKPAATSASEMGTPEPQPTSTTAAPRGRRSDQHRTRSTPMRERAATNVSAIASQPCDRSMVRGRPHSNWLEHRGHHSCGCSTRSPPNSAIMGCYGWVAG